MMTKSSYIREKKHEKYQYHNQKKSKDDTVKFQ